MKQDSRYALLSAEAGHVNWTPLSYETFGVILEDDGRLLPELLLRTGTSSTLVMHS